MPNLKDLRNRISSVQSTRKITRAMQMVAASKLRRAQETAEAARPYAARMEAVLANLTHAMAGRAGAPPLMAGTGREDSHLLIVATAERGLCGGFNSSIVRLARTRASTLAKEGRQVRILCIGRKGRDMLKRDFGPLILDTVELPGGADFATARSIAERVIAMFAAGEFDVCTLFYAHFESVMTQKVTARALIPAPPPEESADAGAALGGAVYDYEPDEEELLEQLLPRNVAVQIFRALLENAASEQGARMSAMDSATRNAGEMIDKLTITYNRTRQAMITKELIEIISGAEAL